MPPLVVLVILLVKVRELVLARLRTVWQPRLLGKKPFLWELTLMDAQVTTVK